MNLNGLMCELPSRIAIPFDGIIQTNQGMDTLKLKDGVVVHMISIPCKTLE